MRVKGLKQDSVTIIIETLYHQISMNLGIADKIFTADLGTKYKMRVNLSLKEHTQT